MDENKVERGPRGGVLIRKGVKRPTELIQEYSVSGNGVLWLHMPIATKSEINARSGEHWRVRKARVDEQTELTCLFLCRALVDTSKMARVVWFQRIGPRRVDSDNYPSCFKNIRDTIAKCFGTHDGPNGPIEWKYLPQTVTKRSGVIVGFEWP